MYSLYSLVEQYVTRKRFDIIEPVFPNVFVQKIQVSVSGSGSVVIVVPDHTRTLRVGDILGFVLDGFSGFDDVKVLFGTGTHNMSDNDVKRLLGDVDVGYSVHDAWSSEHVFVGKTSRDLDVYIDREYAEADVKIVVGVVVPHPWAGFSGGAKLVLPGVSSIYTINEHHTRWFLHKRSRAGVLNGNIFREEIENAAMLAGVDYSLNTVTFGDRIVYMRWSRGLDSFYDCVRVASRIYLRPVPRKKYDVVVADARPFDLNLYQATKAIDHAKLVLNRGGSLILVCECPGGYGGIRDYLDMSKYEIYEGLKMKRFRNLVPPLVALTLKDLQKRVKLYIVSSNISGDEMFEKIELDELESIVKGKRTLFIKQAGTTVPKLDF